jgi:hypothetical protein
MRLDKTIRKHILSKLLAYRFTQKCAELRKKVADFTETIYNDVYSGNYRSQMHDVPFGWLPESNSIKVQFGAEMVEMEFSGGTISSKVGWVSSQNKRSKLVPFKDWSSWGGTRCVKIYGALEAHSITWAQLANDIDDLNDKIDVAETHINTILNSTTTSESLVVKWPEVEPFLKDLVGYKHVPMIQTTKLNELLDLPVS